MSSKTTKPKKILNLIRNLICHTSLSYDIWIFHFWTPNVHTTINYKGNITFRFVLLKTKKKLLNPLIIFFFPNKTGGKWKGHFTDMVCQTIMLMHKPCVSVWYIMVVQKMYRSFQWSLSKTDAKNEPIRFARIFPCTATPPTLSFSVIFC